jgi:hypothetical protein
MCRLETRGLLTVLVRLAGLPVIDEVYKAFAPNAIQLNTLYFCHLALLHPTVPYSFILAHHIHHGPKHTASAAVPGS